MKQPLVLLHGWGVNALIWDPVLSTLESEFDLTVIDLPGYGHDIDYLGDYSLSAIVDQVLARAPEKANWVGWSLGSTVAIAAAIDCPERFLKLQLISPTPRFLKAPDWNLGVELQPYQALAEDFDADYQKALHKFLLLQVLTDDRIQFRKSRALVRDLVATMNQRQRPTSRTLQAGLEILKAIDLRSGLSGLQVETQVIAGRTDHVVPVEASEYLFSQLPNAHSLHVFETGHLPFLQATTKYIEALTHFTNSSP